MYIFFTVLGIFTYFNIAFIFLSICLCKLSFLVDLCSHWVHSCWSSVSISTFTWSKNKVRPASPYGTYGVIGPIGPIGTIVTIGTIGTIGNCWTKSLCPYKLCIRIGQTKYKKKLKFLYKKPYKFFQTPPRPWLIQFFEIIYLHLK